VQLPELRSPLARAVVPVLSGLAFFVVLGGILYGAAVFMARNPEDIRLGDPTFPVGRVDRVAESIATNGPQLYQDLKSPDGKRSIVVTHQGSDDLTGWRVHWTYPADRDVGCFADQSVGTAQFTDCEGRVLDVSQLAVADEVEVVIQDGETLVLILPGAMFTTTTSA
jgi:hypothetical protein